MEVYYLSPVIFEQQYVTSDLLYTESYFYFSISLSFQYLITLPF